MLSLLQLVSQESMSQAYGAQFWISLAVPVQAQVVQAGCLA
jgi:hypothetical protein